MQGIWLTFTTVAVLLGFNVEGSQRDWWFNLPNPLFENDHLINQSVENCADVLEKPFFTMFNVSVEPRKLIACSQSATLKAAWIPSEDILYIECYGKVEWNGKPIGVRRKTNLCHIGILPHCPMLKGKLYRHHAVLHPLPCVMNKGDYKINGYCKNQDQDKILCFKWKFTWV